MPTLKPRDNASIAAVRKHKARHQAQQDELQSTITTNRKDIAKRLAQAPSNVRELAEDAPISVKDADTQFTGRTSDVNSIARRVEGVVKQTSTGRNLTATAITGAPGVGKTTLLLHTIEELKKRKIEVLELNAEQLESDQTFSNAIKQATQGRLQAKLLGAKRIGKDLAVRTVDLGLNFAAQLAKATALFQSGAPVDIEIPTIDIATQTYQAWQQRQVPDVFSVLQTIQYMYPNGVAIVVDEAQNLAKFQPSKNETTCAGHVIASLSTAAGRKRAKMKNTTVLCAGLPDTIDVMSNLGSFGIHRHQLQPLPPESIRKVINGCIDEAAAKNKPLARQAKQLWTPCLTKMYGDWTRHGAAAAQSAKLTLETWGKKALTSDWGWPALITMADITRDRVYEHVTTEAHKHNVPEKVRDSIATALLCNNAEIDHSQLEDIIIAIQSPKWDKMKAATQEREDALESIIRACKHSGLIDQATKHSKEITPGNYYSPIPSLIQHLTSPTKTPKKQIKAWLNDAGLKAKMPKPKDRNGTPEPKSRKKSKNPKR